VAGAGLVRTRQDRIHYAQMGCAADPMSGDTFSGADRTILESCVLERADRGRAHGNDSPASRASIADERCGGVRDPIRLIEGQPRVELRIPR